MNAPIRALVLPVLGLAALGGPLLAQPQPSPAPQAAPTPPVLRPGTVAPLPGRLDGVPMVNDNNPEVIKGPGILLSTFDGQRGYDGRPLGVPAAHLNAAVSGPFELFSHHIYAGTPESLDSTLWVAVVAAPRGKVPVKLRTVAGSTALSQSVTPDQPSAPFLPLPALMEQGTTPIWAGPGSRVATELLARQRSPLVPEGWTLPPGQLSTLMVLPLPVRGLDPLLNGLNLQLRLNSDGPVDVATLAAFGPVDRPPDPAVWQRLLQGGLSPKEHSPSPRGAKGPMIYSRVSGVQDGSAWVGRITDPGRPTLSVSRAPISWPIASLERGTLGTGQVQTAPLRAFYPGTAWAAHGNYGVTYDLTLPLRNDTPRPVQLAVALESPIKTDQPLGGLRFNTTPARAVMFRGTVEVSGLDNDAGGPGGRRRFHLVLRAGQEGPPLGTVSLRPGQERQLRVRLIYPADATPPQVLSLIPVVTPAAPGAGPGATPGAAVKQSGAPPASRP
ncbi:DUF3370 domain-containing protein [Synechococcus sp. FACHB-909]|uniref:DUF3370 domain-containing protein n=1 Tax=Synechococcus sp. FACHB-909 TaxID=2692863 RepID=UPI001684E3E3|nr:DUF3370 domain-containing protein [Synechococcus sp. FACHB-909]MBD2718554.1 DUF3370 domain-containing protein [Synechococcus sp. FACHB-909]